MTNNPVERLRNLLSPYLNLVSILSLEQVKITSNNPALTHLIEKDLRVCAENHKDVNDQLDKLGGILEDRGFVTTPGLDYEDLRKKLDQLLASATKEDLEEWLRMDQERMKRS